MKLFFFIILFPLNLFAKTTLDQGIVNEYLKIHKEFSKTSCGNNTVGNYSQLLKSFLGDGKYIPTTIDDKIDYVILTNFISLMTEKSAWIQSQIEFVKNANDFKDIIVILDHLENELDLYYKNKTQVHIDKIMTLLDEFKAHAPFFLSFKFPIDHLKLRGDYDHYKNANSAEERHRANSIFFYRKIVQDGTFDSEMSKPDATFRAAFDTLYVSIQNKQTKQIELSDSDRVDLLFLINNFTHLLKEGKKKEILRLEEWFNRSKKLLSFYNELLEQQKLGVPKALSERALAQTNLKKFVISNEARAYEYWSRQSELMQSIFVIETILFNEVGRLDSPDALERRDIAQVIINRFENSKYNTLAGTDPIGPYLFSRSNKWLNVLFKEGEFSFTYFYIPGNTNIYCPDMSRVGQFLRRENSRLALQLLNHQHSTFKALRYFSRVSMYGRISMDSLWSDFIPLDEVPGNHVKNSIKIESAFRAHKTILLYKFFNSDLQKNFQVVELKNKKYVIDISNTKNIYYYRSPHLFRYFAPIK